MPIIESLRTEFEHESAATRRMLARLPDEQLDWRPHEKSFTSRALASHLVETIRWTMAIFDSDEFDFNPRTYVAYSATSVQELLETFDRDVENGRQALARAREQDVDRVWRMTMMGRVRVERPKDEAFRDFTLSHMIHHRGQLSVYLRLLDVPVPGAYGPTADEQF